jgi:hypothetical protein
MGFAMDNIALLWTFIYTAQIWLFYDQSRLADTFGITREFMMPYLLFSGVIVPFQIAIDVMHYPLMEIFMKCDFDEWFSECVDHIANKQTTWLLHDKETTRQVVTDLEEDEDDECVKYITFHVMALSD